MRGRRWKSSTSKQENLQTTIKFRLILQLKCWMISISAFLYLRPAAKTLTPGVWELVMSYITILLVTVQIIDISLSKFLQRQQETREACKTQETCALEHSEAHLLQLCRGQEVHRAWAQKRPTAFKLDCLGQVCLGSTVLWHSLFI